MKELGVICEERMPTADQRKKYDRFFMDEFCKKIKTTEEIEQIV